MAQPVISKKKVLVFIPEFPVLTETFIERELAELARRDRVDLRIFSFFKGGGEVSAGLKDRVSYKRLSLLVVLRSLRLCLSRSKNISAAAQMLRECGEPFFSRFYILIKGLGYAQMFSSFGPDFIIAHFMSGSSTVAAVASVILGVPYAISAHAKDVTVKSHCLEKKIEKAAFVLVCNKHAYDYCISSVNSDYSHKILLKYHGLNLSDFERTRGGGEVPVILNVGRLEEKKGQKYLIEAAEIMRNFGVVFKLVIIGPGSLYKELEKMISDKGLSDCVQILGGGEGLPFSETRKFYSEADVFVFPGINTQEGDADGIANVLLEAAASYIPIVATDSGSTEEFLEDGRSALIVPQKDSAALAEALEKLIRDREYAKQLAQEARKRVESDFNIENAAAVIENLIFGGVAK